MDNIRLQGNFKDTNKLCQQYIKDCKQFENVKVIRCNFTSKAQTKNSTIPFKHTETLKQAI